MHRLDIHIMNSPTDRAPTAIRSHIVKKDGQVFLHYNGDMHGSPFKLHGFYHNRFHVLRSLLTSLSLDSYAERGEVLYIRFSLFDPSMIAMPLLSDCIEVVAGDIDYDALAKGFIVHVQLFDSIAFSECLVPALRKNTTAVDMTSL